MRRSLAQLGYVAGILERRGDYEEVLMKSGMLLTMKNKQQAFHIANVLGIMKPRHDGRRFVLYLPRDVAAGWLMTVYSLLSPFGRLRADLIINQWKAMPYKQGVSRCTHTNRAHYSLGYCESCYRRAYRRGERKDSVKYGHG